MKKNLKSKISCQTPFKKIEAKRPLLIPDMRMIEAKRTLLITYKRKINANRTLLIHELKKIKAKRTRLIPEKDRSEKNRRDRSKTNRGGVLKLLKSPRIDSKEFIPPAYALTGRS